MWRRTCNSLMLRSTRTLREQDNWRDHGISFVKYLNLTTTSLHKCVKDTKAAKYTKFSVVGYHAQKPIEGGGWEVTDTVPADPTKY